MELFDRIINNITNYKINILETTSLVFFTNFLHNTWHREYPYAWLFLLLTTTSVFCHSNIFNDIIDEMILIDRSIITAVIIYGGILFWKTSILRETSIIPITTFLSIVYMYCIGYLQNKYCFDPNINIRKITHGALHILACLGHHIIMHEYSILQKMRNRLSNIFTQVNN